MMMLTPKVEFCSLQERKARIEYKKSLNEKNTYKQKNESQPLAVDPTLLLLVITGKAVNDDCFVRVTKIKRV